MRGGAEVVRTATGSMRVLLATDGSADAAETVEWLVNFPLPDDARVEVVTAVPAPMSDESLVWAAWRELRPDAERLVEDVRLRLAKRWPATAARVLDGDPRHAIVEAARERGADLIVLGARGLGVVDSFLLGSVSLGVARHASCSVLVCKGIARPVRAATLALDGSDGASAALRFVGRLPLPPAVMLSLVGVVEPMRYPALGPDLASTAVLALLKEGEDERRRALETVLGAAAAELHAGIRTIVTATPAGAPARAILRESERQNSDLIVVGARGLGTFKRLVLGSVSEAVLRHAGCPVLIVRRPDPGRDV